MSKDWRYSEGEVKKVVKTWVRSQDQRIWCPLAPGVLPELTADIQRVDLYDDGSVVVTQIGSELVRIADMPAGSPDLADALEIQRRLTRILGRRIDPESVVEDPIPEVTP